MSDVVIYGDDKAVISLTKREAKRLAELREGEGIVVFGELGYNWQAVVFIEEKPKRSRE